MNERRAFAVIVVLAVLVLWAARAVLPPFVLAAGIAYAFAPVVSAAHVRTRWPRPLIVGLGYAGTLLAIVAISIPTSGRIGAELAALSAAGPDLVESALREALHAESVTVAGTSLSVTDLAAAIHGAIDNMTALPGEALHVASLVVEVALQGVLVLIVTFYLLVDGHRIRGWMLELIPAGERQRTAEILDHIQATLSRWLRGQMLLVALVAIVSYLFLGPILHVPYALAIALLTGFLEIIPLVGPVIAAALAMTSALVAAGPSLAVAVAVGYFVIRQVEDQLVMPLVVGRVVHLHPVVTIFAVLAGLSIYGILGGLLGVPIAAALNVVFTDLYAATRSPQPDL